MDRKWSWVVLGGRPPRRSSLSGRSEHGGVRLCPPFHDCDHDGRVLLVDRSAVVGPVAAPNLAGAAYGLGLYVVMNYVVIPLSSARPGSKDPAWVSLSILVRMALIGIPMALAARAALQPLARE
jgi:hypothetical protein